MGISANLEYNENLQYHVLSLFFGVTKEKKLNNRCVFDQNLLKIESLKKKKKNAINL